MILSKSQMPAISLPDDPGGVDFEEFIAAVSQAAGLYVEANLIERRKVDLVQLDVLTTDYSESPPTLCIVEAKSGNWGSGDIFKVKGALEHLQPARAALVAKEEPYGVEAYRRLAEKLGISFISMPNLDPAHLEEILPTTEVDEVDVWAWRYCLWLRRKLLDDLRTWRNDNPDLESLGSLVRYAFQVTSGVFFEPTVADRVEHLYEAFGENRNSTARCAHELSGGDFRDQGVERIESHVFNRTFYRCEYNPLHAACWIEHESRLAVLKAAVDYQMLIESGERDRAEEVYRLVLGGKVYEALAGGFPNRFQEALDEIAQEPHYTRYPLVWQWFMGAFGGFIMLDHEAQERSIIARKAGIPEHALDDAFSAYDRLFPVRDGWLVEPRLRRLRLLKLFAGPIRGIGSNYRKRMYTPNAEDFDELGEMVSGDRTLSDLVAWNNMAARVLGAGAPPALEGF